MSEKLLAYIAGFLDGDGCIMAQLVKRPGYIYGFQIRVSTVFYQKSNHKDFLIWLKTKLKAGYIRDRNDGMTEYTIVSPESVQQVLKKLLPYLRLKRELARKVLTICQINLTNKKPISAKEFLKRAYLVDETALYNYSKKRTTTSETVKVFLRQNNLIPRND